ENLYRLAHVSDAELAHLLGRDDAHVRALCSKLCREPAARTVVEPPLDDQFLGIRIALLAGRCAGEHYAAEPKAEAEGRTAHERSWHEKISCLLRYSSKAGRRLLRGGDVLRRGADVCPSPLTLPAPTRLRAPHQEPGNGEDRKHDGGDCPGHLDRRA